MAGLISASATGVMVYALGQASNFLFQLALLKAFGMGGYGAVGLAHLLVLTILFVGDLGYSSTFLREDPAEIGWELRWRQALMHRLVLTILLDCLAVLVWTGLYDTASDGFGYLLGALPTTLLGLVNYSAPLLAQRRQPQGILVQQMAWPCALLGLWLLNRRDISGFLAGSIVSIGFFLQAIGNVVIFGRLRLLWPQFKCSKQGWGMLRSALHISLMGVAGTLHDRLTPFLLAQIAPAFLPIYLLIGQLLNGVSGVFNQFNRLLLVRAKSSAGMHWTMILATLISLCMAIGFQLLLGVVSSWGTPQEQAWLGLLFPVLLAWVGSTVGSMLAAILIGRGLERELLRLILTGLLGSTILQMLALSFESPEGLLWGRLLAITGMVWTSLGLCRVALTSVGFCLFGSALTASFAPSASSFWWLSALLMIVGLGLARHKLLVFREVGRGVIP